MQGFSSPLSEMQIDARVPFMVPVNRWADPSPPTLETEEVFLVESLLSFEHKICSSSELMG